MNAFFPLDKLAVRSAVMGSDAEAIDRFLADHPDAQPFHRPQWSEGVARGCGQRGLFLIATVRSEIAGLLPLTEIRSRLFGSAVVSAGFAVGGGILARDERVASALAERAVTLARERGCASVELRGGWLPAGWQRIEDVHAGFRKSLPRGEEAILAAIPRKQRAEVRRALGHGLEIRIGRSARDLDLHYRAYSESVRNLGTPVFPRALFRETLAAFGENADILTVLKDGQPVSSLLSLYHRDVVYPYWGGGTFAARGLRANELAYFALMRHAAERGCHSFDFGRSKVGSGPFAFKKNWGFEPKPLVYAVHTADGSPARALNPLDPKYHAKIELWKRLPLWAANLAGPIIARGLG